MSNFVSRHGSPPSILNATIAALVLLATAFLLTVSPSAARASEPASPAAETKPKAAELIVDEGAGTVRVLINGKEVVTIDADGLHVTGNIDYTGVIRDIGANPARK